MQPSPFLVALQLQGTSIAPNRDPIPAAWNGTPKQWSNHDLDPAAPLQVFDGGSLFRVQLQVQAEQAEQLRVTIFGLPTVFDFKAKKYQVGSRTAADYAPTVVQIEGIVDVDLAELNIGGVGAVGFRTSSGPDARTPLEVKAVGGKARITSLVVTPLETAETRQTVDTRPPAKHTGLTRIPAGVSTSEQRPSVRDRGSRHACRQIRRRKSSASTWAPRSRSSLISTRRAAPSRSPIPKAI